MDYKNTVNLPQTDFSMKANLLNKEPETLKEWEEHNLSKLLVDNRKNAANFILHDGPPYANGHIHMGHALNKILKDIIVKFKSMEGYCTPYVPGWDCHGLPVEHQLFKELGKTKHEVDLVTFRKQAHQYALKYVTIQKEEFKRLGILGQWDNPYLTLNKLYESRIVEAFKILVEKEYVYQGLKPIHWCALCETALAEAEVEYQDHSSPSIYVQFKITEKDALRVFNKSCVSFIIWTTTPWTLPANVAIALHPDFSYSLVEVNAQYYVLAQPLLKTIAEKLGWNEYKEILSLKGKDLEGIIANHPFIERHSQVVLADYVTMDTGSGCVHTAPGHGHEDYLTGLKYDLPILAPVNDKGCFTTDVEHFAGLHVFKADPVIIDYMKNNSSLLCVEEILHPYPHCWRCKKPVIFRATKQWFITVDKNKMRSHALDLIKSTKWVPAVGEQRISSMIENRPDWCLSRQRLWGVPIPAFYCTECDEVLITPQSIEKVQNIIAEHGATAWFEKPVHELLPENAICAKCSKKDFRKETDILDVWFDSGVSHFAVLKARENLSYPADLYLEGSDQHRGWFQTSLLTAEGIDSTAPFKSVLTHGFVVDGDGKKMSKSAGNVISPEKVMKTYGADILRLWVSSVDYSSDVRISEDIIKQIADAYRRIRNTFRFMLGNIYDLPQDKNKVDYDALTELDKWALSKTTTLLKNVTKHYQSFSIYKVFHLVYEFTNVHLSSFYLDILKDRLYTFAPDAPERRSAQAVFAYILDVLSRILSPILSFTSEELYRYLPLDEKMKSIHLCDWPQEQSEYIDKNLEKKWDRLLKIRSDVLKVIESLRKDKIVGNSLECFVQLSVTDKELHDFIKTFEQNLDSIFIVSKVSLEFVSNEAELPESVVQAVENKNLYIRIEKRTGQKCARCWRYTDDIGSDDKHSEICARCAAALVTIPE